MTDAETGTGNLGALRILIVEDEYYVADDLARALQESGASVIGPVATLAEAERAVAEGHFDCAVLDMNLRGEMAFPIADRLEAEGIPYVCASGYNVASLPERFGNVPRVEKPYDPMELIAMLPGLGRRS
jgi:DNA-binding response OmpR family regulator